MELCVKLALQQTRVNGLIRGGLWGWQMEIGRAEAAACDFPHIECVFNYQRGDAKAAAFARQNARMVKW